ncbi:hypothetical protein [Magnetospirillum fulvum]|uniref:ATPase dynein-related AAA domain-containing protein n=1 Tax=Magnetospirillum fulvum MGU-K5 TaxID=1316936 RepID=S9TR06_MAGFU|nr:hypothetical protein [Magnetospirillum fulvum]EPY00975.1 hypothetical protein K678_13378 [Magnetospirillum fulvum MGU-K5]
MAFKDKRYFFAVGQKSFEAGANANHFSTVVPIAASNGEVIDDRKATFPNRGRVWWMLRGEVRVTHAPPGCLILSGIEASMDSSYSPDRDIYQLLQPTLPGPKDLLEILTPGAEITDPNELLDDFRMRCDHEPTRHVLVRIGEYLYGPLKVEFDRLENDRVIEPEIRFTKPVAPHTVYRITAAEAVGRSGYIRQKAVVQRDISKPNDQCGHTVQYEAVTGTLYEELREGADEVDIVSLQEAVRQVSRDFLVRRERREFIDRLSRFAEEAQSSPAVIARVRHFLGTQSKELDALSQIFDALLSDASFKPKIDQAVATEVEKRVDAQAAQIDARAKERVKELSTKIEELSAEFKAENEKFEAERVCRYKALESELDVMRKASERELEAKREDLIHQEEIVSKSLETVAQRLERSRTGVLNDFLALEPLLRRLGLSDTPKLGGRSEPSSRTETSVPAFKLPDFSVARSERAPMPEEAFFERFVAHVEKCGFVFSREDLLAFHLSAKERAPVILGGVSGSGKSSLPVLYAEALAGQETDKRFLAVDVNPSWTSPSDLLGYTDALEYRFVPAASGMMNQMIFSFHASKNIGSLSPVFSVCLEELNLAQPEHYLADIIQAISRAPGNQLISVFDPNAVRIDDPFRPFARFELSPNLIIVGTVNFDETTRPLSMRLLDRCNLIEFAVDERLPVLGMTAQTGAHQVEGQPVLQFDRDRWTRNTNVPARAIEVLGEMQAELSTLGCGLTHRRQTLICRFLANAPESLCSFDQALDMQLRQRILPQIRGLYRPGAMEAVRRLSDKLEKACNVPRTLQALARLEADARSRDEMFLGEE